MSGNSTQILSSKPIPSAVLSGFKEGALVDRLCFAFGNNLGGNAPTPSWFEGYEVVVATRQTIPQRFDNPTLAILRRIEDGALRLVASDHIFIMGAFGCDMLIAPSHRMLTMDAVVDASDDSVNPKYLKKIEDMLFDADPIKYEGITDILAERRRDHDLTDMRMIRSMKTDIDTLFGSINNLQSPERKAAALRRLEGLCSELGIEIESKEHD